MRADKILIVEDDPAILFGLKDNLEMAGFDVISAVDGELGLERARKDNPDLILLDIMLPGLNGFEICKELRSAEQEMPIIMLTARGQEEDIIRGLNLGADDYVTKPFSIQQLIARVRSLLRRSHKSDVSVIDFSGMELNTDSKQLSKNGQTVELTPKEYGLLEYLLKNRGRALTRDQILNSVWGSDLVVTERSVDRCVTSLRSKIEDNPSRPQILKTVQKIGYRFEDGSA